MGAPRDLATRAPAPARTATGRRLIEIGIGALLVAVAAQVAVPVPFTPVPMTLQPLAVLVVGGLLGAAGGLAALTTYLALGLLGLPVFAGGSSGVVHVIGPDRRLPARVSAGGGRDGRARGALGGRAPHPAGLCRSAWW